MLRSVRFWLALILVCVLAGFLIHSAFRSQQTAQAPVISVSDEADETTIPTAATEKPATFFTTRETMPETETTAVTAPAEDEPHADQPFLTQEKAADLLGHAEILAGLTDYTGWIYLPDSAIDYPVMQGTDNFYYLSHLPDGREADFGSIMLDCRNQHSYADAVSILYGHNLSYGMFGDLRSFKEQAEFDLHKYGWLATPDTLFRIDFFALAIVSGYDSVYDLPCQQTEWLQKIRASAMHDSGLAVSPEDALIALSTCTAENLEEARALFVGRLVPMQQPEDYLKP